MARVRIRNSYISGVRTLKGNGVPGTSTITNYERCEDIVGPGDNGVLDIRRKDTKGGQITGEGPSDLSGYIFEDYPCTYVAGNIGLNSHLTIPGRPTNGTLAAQALARTQPMRPAFISWEYLNELPLYGSSAQKATKEAVDNLTRKGKAAEDILDKYTPGLDRTRKVIRRVAGFNVLSQFALSPIISDIGKLLKFQELVDARYHELKRLYGGTGLRRTLSMWEGTEVTNSPNVLVQSSGVSYRADIHKMTHQMISAHVRWKTLVPQMLSDSEIRAKARSVLTGFQADPHTAYELMPWSWLIDYFTNIGSIVKINKNLLELTYSTPTIMEHTRSEISSSNHNQPIGKYGIPFRMTPIYGLYETKKRTPASASLLAQEAVLNDRQLSILGSLAVLRGLR